MWMVKVEVKIKMKMEKWHDLLYIIIYNHLYNSKSNIFFVFVGLISSMRLHIKYKCCILKFRQSVLD